MQDIKKGSYLYSDLDLSTLTISQVHIFGFNFPSLVQIFNDQIKLHTVLFKRKRLSRQDSLASEGGITDGVKRKVRSGMPILYS